MFALPKCWIAGIVVVLLANTCQADTGIVWQSDFAAAQKLATQQNRLLLVHFGAPWCQPCLRLEKQVFHQPGFGRELSQRFVAVKLNYDDNRELALRLGVQAIPADCILSPQGQLIQRVQSPPTTEAYIATMLRTADYAAVALSAPNQATPSATAASPQVAATVQPTAQPTVQPNMQPTVAEPRTDAIAAATAPSTDATTNSIAATAASQSPPSSLSNSNAPTEREPASAHTSASAQPQVAAALQLPPNSPPLGLEGFCPVTLMEQRRWITGDVRWGAIHHGRTYLFASEQNQQQFLNNPDHFSPVMGGSDPVLAMDDGQTVAGDRRHGVFFADRVYLFRDEDSLKRFSQNPNRYSAEVTQAMR